MLTLINRTEESAEVINFYMNNIIIQCAQLALI